MWLLLIGSFSFGLYKNFTAIDTHTIHETTVIEPVLVDTHAIESFTLNFIQEYYSWENNKEAIEQRPERINRYLTSELQELNVDKFGPIFPRALLSVIVKFGRYNPLMNRIL